MKNLQKEGKKTNQDMILLFSHFRPANSWEKSGGMPKRNIHLVLPGLVVCSLFIADNVLLSPGEHHPASNFFVQENEQSSFIYYRSVARK